MDNDLFSCLSSQTAAIVDNLNNALSDESLSHNDLKIAVREAVLGLAIISDVLRCDLS